MSHDKTGREAFEDLMSRALDGEMIDWSDIDKAEEEWWEEDEGKDMSTIGDQEETVVVPDGTRDFDEELKNKELGTMTVKWENLVVL
jgi:hypothetical protein